MAKTKEELKELKQEYEALNNKLKELSEDELQMVVGGIIDFVIPIDDEAAYYLKVAYDDIARVINNYKYMKTAYNFVELALKSDNNNDRFKNTIKAISYLELEPNKDHTLDVIMNYLSIAKDLIKR